MTEMSEQPPAAQASEPMSIELEKAVTDLFAKMDKDGNRMITRKDLKAFFKSKLTKIFCTDVMFKEVDADGKDVGYAEEDILAELDSIHEDNAWVTWHMVSKKEETPESETLAAATSEPMVPDMDTAVTIQDEGKCILASEEVASVQDAQKNPNEGAAGTTLPLPHSTKTMPMSGPRLLHQTQGLVKSLIWEQTDEFTC